MRTRVAVAIALVSTLLVGETARAESSLRLIAPVDAAIERPFDPPAGRFGPGHRGLDYAAPSGTPVRAAADGTVGFAGPVAGVLAVTIDHGAGVETTYTDLAEISVREGARVDEGSWIGTSGRSHDGRPGLHFGVKVNGGYVDPATMLGAFDVSGAIHLAPLVWSPRSLTGLGRFLEPAGAGSHERACVDREDLLRSDAPPNDNIAVAVAGISSRTRDGVNAAVYENGPEQLGYPEDRIYRFSYRGVDGPRLHEPYERTDTYRDLRSAAARLRDLMRAIRRRHPDASIDLIAHSQGGLVARLYLERYADAWDSSVPPVEHLVTLATPHQGAPVALEGEQIDDGSFLGSTVLDGLSAWSRNGGPVPDPRSVAVAQLAPGSDLLRTIAAEDIAYGTRALSLTIANDLVVPAERAGWPGEVNRVVPPAGVVTGHGRITTSAPALALAHAFLSGRPIACPTWDDDVVGPAMSVASEWLGGRISTLYGKAEESAFSGALGIVGVPAPVGRIVYRGAAATKRFLRGGDRP